MLTITYILFALSVGMIIGGFAFGNNTVGIIGVVFAVVDIIVGITMTYFKNKRDKEYALGQLFAAPRKIQNLKSNPLATEIFTISELANAVVNLFDALQVLPATEYSYLQKIYDAFQRDVTCITVTFREYLLYCDKIISNYDMVAPYYKVCGSSELELSKWLEDDKQPYRKKAKNLIDNGKLFSDEWKLLNQKFYKEFYETDDD